MIKFVYIVGLFITSSLLFVFSKEKSIEQCSNEAKGVITLNDTTGVELMILTEENKKLVPQTINKDVLLIHSQNTVSVCYKVDSSKLIAGSAIIPVNIERVVYIK